MSKVDNHEKLSKENPIRKIIEAAETLYDGQMHLMPDSFHELKRQVYKDEDSISKSSRSVHQKIESIRNQNN